MKISGAASGVTGDFVMVTQAHGYAVREGVFAVESAYAEHLKLMRQVLGDRFRRLVLIGPTLDAGEYERRIGELGEIDETEHGIAYMPAHPTSISRPAFWLRQLLPVWRTVNRAVRQATVVQAGMSTELGRPVMAIASIAAWWHRRPLVYVVDIDFRQHAKRFYLTGQWSLKSFIVNRYVYDPLKWIQLWLAPKISALVLLKSMTLVRDFGRGLPHVKNFFDTVQSASQVLDETEARLLQQRLRRTDVPLTAVYFGRLARNKGVNLMIEAVRLARERGVNLRLSIIGDGECLADLQRQAHEADLEDRVSFAPPVSYGESLFTLLEQADVCLAAPLIEDTPRAAFDAMARGLPIVAFDITYFRDIAAASEAVALAAWPSAEELAKRLIELSQDRERLARMAANALRFAASNTQSFWLETRMSWLYEYAVPQH
jgi:glycosyltransferase involved in cell wall biosynthesis